MADQYRGGEVEPGAAARGAVGEMLGGSGAGAPQQPAEGDVVDSQGAGEDHPAFRAAVAFLKKALYKEGAADYVHDAVKRAESPVEILAAMAYEAVNAADQKTNGEVPDELVVLLIATAIQEIAEIAEASGVALTPEDIASIFKIVVLKYIKSLGYDVTELHKAMNQIKPEQFRALVEGAANG